MAAILLDHVSKVFGGDVVAVDDISLEIESGEFLVLVGPSGCGKSTLLRMIAGLEEVSEGTIAIDTREVTDLPPRSRDIAMVFQSYALYPHMTVRENLEFGLRIRKTPQAEIDKLVNEAAEILGITQLLERKPKAMSGRSMPLCSIEAITVSVLTLPPPTIPGSVILTWPLTVLLLKFAAE